MSPQDDALKIEAKERARADTEKQLEKVRSIYKFHFFFTALVFAILSFAIQFPVSSENLWIKIMEVVSWVPPSIARSTKGRCPSDPKTFFTLCSTCKVCGAFDFGFDS